MSRAQALARGMTARQVDHRLHTGEWLPVFERVYRLGPVPETPTQRLTAAVLWLGGDAIVSHQAGAWLWGFPGFEPCVELSVGSASHWTGPGFTVHSARDLEGTDVTFRDGFRVTTAARTLFDIARQCPEHELAIAMDHALRVGFVSLGALNKLLLRLGGKGKPGTAAFRRVLAERRRHRASGDSPPETLLRRAIREAGLPDPVPQFPISLVGKQAFIDLAFPRWKVAIEIYSDEFHSDRYQGKKDARRITELARLGWRVLTPLAEDIERDPASVLKALVDTLAEAGGAVALRRGRRVNALNGTD